MSKHNDEKTIAANNFNRPKLKASFTIGDTKNTSTTNNLQRLTAHD